LLKAGCRVPEDISVTALTRPSRGYSILPSPRELSIAKCSANGADALQRAFLIANPQGANIRLARTDRGDSLDPLLSSLGFGSPLSSAACKSDRRSGNSGWRVTKRKILLRRASFKECDGPNPFCPRAVAVLSFGSRLAVLLGPSFLPFHDHRWTPHTRKIPSTKSETSCSGADEHVTERYVAEMNYAKGWSQTLEMAPLPHVLANFLDFA